MLIVEIGNNHFGNFEDAKEMIRVAKDCGADIVKSQAFLARDIKGSMPYEFYRSCEFSLAQYEELIYFARDIGIELFYSVFSKIYESLFFHQRYFKIAGSQTRNLGAQVEKKDSPFMFVSIPERCFYPNLKRAHLMFVTEYMDKTPNLDMINHMSKFYGRQVGLSDHSVGLTNCLKAIEEYGVNLIEKHFSLGKKIAWHGTTYRDAVHGASPREIQELAKRIGGMPNE